VWESRNHVLQKGSSLWPSCMDTVENTTTPTHQATENASS